MIFLGAIFLPLLYNAEPNNLTAEVVIRFSGSHRFYISPTL